MLSGNGFQYTTSKVIPVPSAAVSRQSVCAIVLSGTIIVVRLAQGGSAARAVATG
ncbi:Uncharacterised protein [Mycobacteroides abscessus subsp. abscessus]|nr:Uncharacterised protein [Mycobacteroides abscessus subsp. abscessus]